MNDASAHIYLYLLYVEAYTNIFESSPIVGLVVHRLRVKRACGSLLVHLFANYGFGVSILFESSEPRNCDSFRLRMGKRRRSFQFGFQFFSLICDDIRGDKFLKVR